jgi:signal peptidase I
MTISDSKVQPLAGTAPSTTTAPEASPTLPVGVATPARPAAHHSRRGDYRLRGLDVRVEDPVEVPRRQSWKGESRKRRRRRVILKCGVVLMIAAGIAVALRATVVQPFSVPTAAMSPTLKAGDQILVTKASFLTGSIGKGSIVVFTRPKHFSCSTNGASATDLVQRVIATPGETIWSSGNTIYVNGRALEERGWYNAKAAQVAATPIRLTTIPSGQYFVMDDNRTNTCDSRSFGTISRTSIIGKVAAVVLRNGHPYFRFF